MSTTPAPLDPVLVDAQIRELEHQISMFRQRCQALAVENAALQRQVTVHTNVGRRLDAMVRELRGRLGEDPDGNPLPAEEPGETSDPPDTQH